MRIIHDIEVYPNFFSDTCLDYDTGEIKQFEISHRRNEVKEYIQYIMKSSYLIGFNSIEYDDLHIAYIIENRLLNRDCATINRLLYEFTELIIKTKENYEIIKPYKYFFKNKGIKQIDLLMYWSKMLRKSKMLSLKSLAVQLNHNNIQELPYKPGSFIDLEQMDNILEYNINDVNVTRKLLTEMKEEVNLRMQVEKKYNINCISRDAVNLGSDLFLKLYSEKLNLNPKEVRQKRTYRDSVKLSDVIFDNVEFKKGSKEYHIKDNRIYCKSFYGLLELLKKQTVTSTNELNYTVIYNNVKYDFGSGGIHAFGTKKIYESNDNYTIIDADVGSYYPALICEYGLYPKHLGKEWTELYDEIRKERIIAKKTDKLKASVYKLLLNGSFGLLNNQYSWLYDWSVTMSVTVNGQLFLTMLAEELTEAGINVYTLNTDGLSSHVHKNQIEEYYRICKEWENKTKMVLEYEEYKSTIMMNVNNYIWINKDNKPKTKGLFVTKPVLGNSSDFLVIPKALKAYFVNNIEPEKFIKEHDNIFDFTAANKIAKSYTVIWMNEIQQQLNRYYVSKKGGYLYKQKPDKNQENVLKGYGVMLYNKHEAKPMQDYHIDYQYYINKVREIINELKPKQMALF